jgi:Sugar kinases, ribokinase family
MNYLIKKNKKLNVIITNGKNAVNAYLNKIFYLSYPPSTNVKDENGAGDALSAIFNYFYCNSLNESCSLNKAISGGSLEASKYKNKKENYLQKIDKLSRSIKFKIIKKYE